VIFTYLQKYQGVANSWAHHLMKYMEGENGSPTHCWFSYPGLVPAAEMEWNKEEEHSVLNPSLNSTSLPS